MTKLLPTLALLLTTPALVGCLGAGETAIDASDSSDSLTWTPCAHPWPCADGTEWPEDLEGPFELDSVERVRVPGHDGVELDGWVFLPALPDGVSAPTVLVTSPYWGQLDQTPPQRYGLEGYHTPFESLVEHGYAVAAFSARGTGYSDGCYDAYGPDEQQDQPVLVEWIADQAWSNERVGVYGISYMGTTAAQAAVLAPPSLKTVVMTAVDSDVYLLYNTPQGAPLWYHSTTPAWFTAGVSVAPPAYGGPQHMATGPLDAWADHMCPDVATMVASWSAAPLADERSAAMFEERRLIHRFGNITASVLLSYGFHDYQVAFQDDVHWPLLDAPKHQVVGNWGHATPWVETGDEKALFEWLDFWLKGLGDPPASLGTVTYQDTADTWRNTTTWPPAEARDRTVYLDGDHLSEGPTSQSRTLQSAPAPSGRAYLDILGSTEDEDEAICLARAGSPATALYTGKPLDDPAVLAGSPFAYLNLTSDQPGGIVSVGLYALSPGFSCEDGMSSGARRLGGGAADLRFHQGGYRAEAFPTAEPTHVRIDISGMASHLDAGEQLAVLVGRGGPLTYSITPYAPTLTLHGESHVVLPVLEGDLGGPPTSIDYPPRPFVPEGSP